MDEGYTQKPSHHKIGGTSLNPLFDQINYQGNTVTSLDAHWEQVTAFPDILENP